MMIIDLPSHINKKGTLTVVEEILPFAVKRIYWIYDSDNNLRGGHRHKVTRQALVAINGEVTINIENGNGKTSIILDKPSKCLIVEPEDWHNMLFKKNSILLVFASHIYNKNDYIDQPLKIK